MTGETMNERNERVTRQGVVTWVTHPPSGTARIETESHAFGAMPVTLREGDPVPDEATPGELLAVAHAMLLAAALAEDPAGARSPADEIVVEASCDFTGPLSPPDRELAALDLKVRARGRGLAPTGFRE